MILGDKMIKNCWSTQIFDEIIFSIVKFLTLYNKVKLIDSYIDK